MARTDILLDDGYELQTNGEGDFVQGDGTVDQTALIIWADLGHYKPTPTIGVGIHRALGSTTQPSVLESKIVEQMKKDGHKTPRVDASDMNDIKVNAIKITSQ